MVIESMSFINLYSTLHTCAHIVKWFSTKEHGAYKQSKKNCPIIIEQYIIMY